MKYLPEVKVKFSSSGYPVNGDFSTCRAVKEFPTDGNEGFWLRIFRPGPWSRFLDTESRLVRIIWTIEILTIDRTEKPGPEIPDHRADPEFLTGPNFELIRVTQKWVRVILDYPGVSDQSSKQEVIQMLSFHSFTGCINYIIL